MPLLCLLSAFAAPAQDVPFELTDREAVAFVHAHVVPMSGTQTLPDHTVIVEDGFISAVAPDGTIEIPEAAVVVDVGGQFLAPGLADMHTHLGAEVPVRGGIGENQAQVYLALGVTTLLNQGDFEAPFGADLIPLARQIRDGKTAGPTIYTGSYARGPSDGGAAQQIVVTERDGREHVTSSKAAGYDYIKVYNGVSRDAFEGIITQSAVEEIAVIGHFPTAVGTAQALADGLMMPAHAEAYFYTHFDMAIDRSRIPSAIDHTLTAGAWVCTTLYIQETIAAIWGSNEAAFDAFLEQPEMRYVHPLEIDVWRRGFEGDRWSPPGSQPGQLDAQFAFVKEYTRDFHDAGIPLVLGTDSPTVLGAPGFSTHEEMRVIGQLGLGNFEILAMATRNAGEFVALTLAGSEPFGTVEPGKRADLLLLEADPLEDLANLRGIVGVMARGRFYSRANLDARLERVAQDYAAAAPPPPPSPPPVSGGGGGGETLWILPLLAAAPGLRQFAVAAAARATRSRRRIRPVLDRLIRVLTGG